MRAQKFVVAVLFSLILFISNARAGGWDYIGSTAYYTNNRSPTWSFKDTSLNHYRSLGTYWSPPHKSLYRRLDFVYQIYSYNGNFLPNINYWRVNIWSGSLEMIASPLQGNILSWVTSSPQYGSITAPWGTGAFGPNYLIGFEIPDTVVTTPYTLVGVVPFFPSTWGAGGVTRTGIITQSGWYAQDIGNGPENWWVADHHASKGIVDYVQNMGPGCGVQLTNLDSNFPTTGQSWTMTLSNLVPNTFGVIYASIGFFSPVNLGNNGGVPCNIYLELSPWNFIALATVVADGNGTATATLPIPPDPGLDGLPLTIQAATVNAASQPFGVDISNAIQVIIRQPG